ncbi:MAG: methylmalonyl-CoA carboxyltransferase [Burkholderiales bacterium]|nr:methylmalonyl-CoA carboxyltransferase [Burkholderiales bacterium]
MKSSDVANETAPTADHGVKATAGHQKFAKQILEHSARAARARAMGGPEKLAKRAKQGLLNARERIDYLLDKGSFRESGLFGVSYIPEMRDSTPCDGKVTGFGKIEGRRVGVVGYDFTVKASSSSYTNNRKMAHIKDTGGRRGFPVIFLGESTGVRMPDIMGEGMGMNFEGNRFLRTRDAPWVAAILGNAFGSAAWHACCSDFCVMRKGSVMAVASPRVVSMALGREVSAEELGGWQVLAEHSGFADLVVDTDEQALDAIKRFLSYLPTNNRQPPPVAAVPEGSDEPVKGILDLFPESATQAYDVRKIIRAIADKESFFEVKERFGRSITTALARIDGRPVGIIANNPLFKGGAMEADACNKATDFIVLCDSYNVPLVFLQDQPGFLIGPEAEKRGVIGRVINWMNALLQVSVPKISIILRKSYGRGFINMGGAGIADEIAAWWTAEVSFMNPRTAVTVVHGIKEEDDPERFAKLLADMARTGGAYDLAAVYGVKEVLDPRETREYLKETLDTHTLRLSSGVGQHRLANWPTSY